MKRLISLVLVLLLALSFAACTGKSNQPSPSQSPDGTSGATKTEDTDNADDTDDTATPSEQPSTSGGFSDKREYSEAYTRLNEISVALSDFLTNKLSEHNSKLEAENPDGYFSDPNYLGFVFFLPLINLDLAFTATLGESEYDTRAAGLAMAIEMFGGDNVKVNRNAAHDYFITYDGTTTDLRTGDKTPAFYEMTCKYDPGTDALRFVSYKTVNGEKSLDAFYEFAALGGDTYAFQTKTERAVIGYKNNGITTFAYSQAITPDGADFVYDVDKDSIFPNASGVNESWVTALGADNLEQIAIYNGSSLSIEVIGDMFSDTRKSVTI